MRWWSGGRRGGGKEGWREASVALRGPAGLELARSRSDSVVLLLSPAQHEWTPPPPSHSQPRGRCINDSLGHWLNLKGNKCNF